MHTHLSLFEGDRNAFFEPGAPYQLSKVARSFIAGLIVHAPEITAVTNQWVNSYKRLTGGAEAPAWICWGHNNRSALIRVPMYKPSKGNSTRIEVRSLDSACNPYLAFAVQMMAGLDGIINKIEPHAPVDKDLYELPREEAKLIPQVPGTLEEALEALENDHEFLLQGGVFTKDLIDTWIEFKRTNEILPAAQRPHPFEFELYFGV
jgi:glutamine synthetase